MITSPTKLIFHGDSYERGEWPWLVAIYKKKEDTVGFVCAGTLVSDRHVITGEAMEITKNTNKL